MATHALPLLPSELGVKSVQMCIIQAGTETDGFCIGHVYFLLARLKHVICCHTCPCEILARNQFDFQCQAAFFNVCRYGLCVFSAGGVVYVPPGSTAESSLSEIIVHNVSSKSLQSCSFSSRKGHSHFHLPKLHEGHDLTCNTHVLLGQGTAGALCCPFCMSQGCVFNKIPCALSWLGQPHCHLYAKLGTATQPL